MLRMMRAGDEVRQLEQQLAAIRAEKAAADARIAELVAAGQGAGAMAATKTLAAEQSAREARIAELEQAIQAFEGALPVRRLDPLLIKPSRWANRHDAAFSNASFDALKAEILSAGGNVQPIKVRPVGGVVPYNSGAGEAGVGGMRDGSVVPYNGVATFEIVFGHRRHRACLELGLPVLAMVEAVADADLFVAMERENRARADLSAWEQGRMYLRALDQGLFPSQGALAKAIGIDKGNLSKALALARLPQAVIDAFEAPTDLQYRWAGPLVEAQTRDPEGLFARARQVAEAEPRLSPKEVFERLVRVDSDAVKALPEPVEIKVAGQGVGQVLVDRRGAIAVTLKAGTLPAGRRAALAKAIAEFLRGQERAER